MGVVSYNKLNNYVNTYYEYELDCFGFLVFKNITQNEYHRAWLWNSCCFCFLFLLLCFLCYDCCYFELKILKLSLLHVYFFIRRWYNLFEFHSILKPDVWIHANETIAKRQATKKWKWVIAVNICLSYWMINSHKYVLFHSWNANFVIELKIPAKMEFIG